VEAAQDLTSIAGGSCLRRMHPKADARACQGHDRAIRGTLPLSSRTVTGTPVESFSEPNLIESSGVTPFG
jgi:hypothetical protein